MDSMTARLSGMSQEIELVTGTEVNGFFVHLPVQRPLCAHLWTVSHTQSGLNMGAMFEKLKDAKRFAQELSETYDGHCDANTLIEQLKARGDKPSVVVLAERNHMLA